MDVEHVEVEPARDIDSATDDGDGAPDAPDDALVIVADIAEADVSADEPMRSEVSADEQMRSDVSDDATQAMPVVGNGRAGQEPERDGDGFRFSFDDDRN
jgi:cobalamin biosynthesis protein CobT